MKSDILRCPTFCQYEGAECTRIKGDLELQDAFFAYPSKPATIGSQIHDAINLIKEQNICNVQDWQDLTISGKVIYCEICKSIRRSGVLVADITTLNDNVLFELGFAIGLGKRLWLIRDSSFEESSKRVKALGLLEYTGYTDFRNSADIMTKFITDKPWESKADGNHAYYEPKLLKGSKLLYLKNTYNNDGSIQLTSLVKKSRIPTDTIDPRENTQLSLRDFSRRVSTSLGVVVHMCEPSRKDATIHNARCTFLAGMALAMEKPIIVVQEGEVERPIDYGEIIRTYTNSNNIRLFFERWLDHVQANLKLTESILDPVRALKPSAPGKLEALELGDVAAENEIEDLKNYFVRTPIYQTIMAAKDCIVAGRKGTGKTALFYEVRRTFWTQKKFIVLDLKPEGYQLKLFSDIVVKNFPESTKQYLLKSFWEYVILSELGRKILQDDNFAFQKQETIHFYKEVERNINPLGLNWEGDFAQRLLELVNHLSRKLHEVGSNATPAEITNHLYLNELGNLRKAIAGYLPFKSGTVILIDNLDKDWKPLEDISIEMDILRSLLDSLKSLSNDLSRQGVEFKSVVYIRSDILKLLNKKTPDKGKDKVIQLQWQDVAAFKEIIKSRFGASGYSFDSDWNSFFPDDCRGLDSFSYLTSRTLMRPRDLLTFCRLAIDTAISRGHATVREEDIIFTEKQYSTGMLEGLTDEIRDVYGDLQNCLFEFLGEEMPIDGARLTKIVAKGISEKSDAAINQVIDLLLEYGFLGVETAANEYSYHGMSDYNLMLMRKRAEKYCEKSGALPHYAVHPTFRSGLEIGNN